MLLNHEILNIGIEKPLRILHLSDTHICEADMRDNERKRTLAEKRGHVFEKNKGDCLRFLDEALAYGKQNCDLLVHTGDLIDFVSEKNIEVLKEKLNVMDTFFAPGNHEFSLYVGEAWEDTAYKMQSFHKIEAVSCNPLDFSSRIVNGLNLVAVDDSYYLFEPRHLESLKAEAAKGLPIILCMHNPIHTDDLYHYQMDVRKESSAFLTGTPDELRKCYSELRWKSQKPDAPTLAFIEYVKQEPLIKAVFAGHLHCNYKTWLTPALPQIVTGGGFDETATEIEIL